MKTHRFKTQLWLPQPRERVFLFFSNPHNLDRLTPAWLNFEILTPLPVLMKQGALMDYRLRIRGIPIRWQSEITLWEPPLRFADRQIRGPYRLWVHTHNFFSREGGTLVEDCVQYATLGGSIVQRLLVAPDLRRIFSYRHEVLQQLFGADGAAP